MGIEAAIIGTALVGAGSSYMAGEQAADAAKAGASAEERIAKQNLEFQQGLADQQREDFAPWRDVGAQALQQIWSGVQSGEFDVGQIDVRTDPGYQLRMDEGMKALEASAAARGGGTGGTRDMKNILRYGQGLASQEYGAAYNRALGEKTRKFNILSGLSQGGQASAAGQAQATSQLASTGGNILANTGRAQNIARQNMGAARAGAYQDMAQAANQGAQNWLTYKMAQ